MTVRISDSAAIMEIYEYYGNGTIENTVNDELVRFGYDGNDDQDSFQLWSNLQEFDVCVLDNKGEKLIAVDKWEFACLFADGVTNEIDVYQYKGNKLRYRFDDYFCGSAADDEECRIILNQNHGTGGRSIRMILMNPYSMNMRNTIKNS